MVHWLEKLGIRHITSSREASFIFVGGLHIIKDAREAEDIASSILEITDSLGIPFVFKVSFARHNRVDMKAYSGPGINVGLAILHSIRERLKIPVLVDVHNAEEIPLVSEVVDFIQVPSYLSLQTDFLASVARTNKIINIQKSHSLSPHDMKHLIDKIKLSGNSKYIITEMGTSFGYDNIVSDFRSIPIMSKYAPVLYDASYSVNFKDKLGRKFVPTLSRAAIVSGARGLYMEVHPDPSSSFSDVSVVFPLSKLKGLLSEALDLYKLALSFKDL